MPRQYLRLSTMFDERKHDYPDGPYATLIAILCQAEFQPVRGRFRSLTLLKRLLGRRSRHVRYLIDHSDLAVLDDESVYVVGWDEWQEGDWKVAERMQRIRARRARDRNAIRNGDRNGDRNGIHGDAVYNPSTLYTHDVDSNGNSISNDAAPSTRGDALSQGEGATSDEAARYRAIVDDETQEAWRRDVARAQLRAMALRERGE